MTRQQTYKNNKEIERYGKENIALQELHTSSWAEVEDQLWFCSCGGLALWFCGMRLQVREGNGILK